MPCYPEKRPRYPRRDGDSRRMRSRSACFLPYNGCGQGATSSRYEWNPNLSPNSSMNLQRFRESLPTGTETRDDLDFILVTPESIGMDKNGDVANHVRPPRVCFRPILKISDDEDDDSDEAAPNYPAMSSLPVNNCYQLPMKVSSEDPFESLFF